MKRDLNPHSSQFYLWSIESDCLIHASVTFLIKFHSSGELFRSQLTIITYHITAEYNNQYPIWTVNDRSTVKKYYERDPKGILHSYRDMEGCPVKGGHEHQMREEGFEPSLSDPN
jgi:hypothetical protein